MNKGDVLNEIAALEEKIVKIKEDKTVWRMIWAGSTYFETFFSSEEFD